MRRLGLRFECLAVDVDETWNGHEDPSTYVARLALEKARAGRAAAPGPLPVLAADTEVALDGLVLGKPRDADDAARMLSALSGRTHSVHCAVALLAAGESTALELSRVSFRSLSRQAINAYCAGGEPLDKAGAYAIQGRAAAFVTRLEGSYSGVVGLPLAAVSRLLAEAGVIMAHAFQQTECPQDHRLA